MSSAIRLQQELAVALEVVEAAGAEVMRLYRSFAEIADAPADVTTDADLASQELILKRLADEFPNDRLCGEETTAALERERLAGKPETGRMWIVDPIDGTRGFARKNGEFSIMLALVEQGSPVVGVVLEPAIGRLTYAVRAAGCHFRPSHDAPFQRAHVNDTAALAGSTVAMSRSRGADGEAKLLGLLGAKRGVQTYSAGIKLAQVARGDADVYLGDYPSMHDWDLAAGCILVEESGGRVTDWDGNPLLFGQAPFRQRLGIAASNGNLHAELLNVVGTSRDAVY
jgi:3'(2'), 5'-bisphosphate nucleotidase